MEKGELNMFISEVGHYAQNAHLIAVSKGLNSIPIGALDDKILKRVLTLPEHLDPLYIIPIGYKK